MTHRPLLMLSLAAVCLLSCATVATAGRSTTRPSVTVTVRPGEDDKQARARALRDRNTRFVRSRVGALAKIDQLRRWRVTSRTESRQQDRRVDRPRRLPQMEQLEQLREQQEARRRQARR